MMTNVLITGATGFIGSHLVKRLVKEGYTVYCMIRHSARRDLKSLEDVLDQVCLIQGDLIDYHSVRASIKASTPEYVINLAALTPVRFSFENPFSYIDADFKGVANMVHAILEEAPKAHLIQASTAEVYGWQKERQPFAEDQPLNPASPYAVAKAAADMYVRMSGEVYGLQYTVLRPVNTYGRLHETGFITEYLVTNMLKGSPVYIGAPESVREYMYVEDHVDAYVTVMKADEAIGEVFNVSTGVGVSNRELAEKIASLVGYDGKIVCGSYPPGYPQRPAYADPTYLVLDGSKIRQKIRWEPKYTLEEGLKKTVNFWKNKISV